jgi:hypothetical protein
MSSSSRSDVEVCHKAISMTSSRNVVDVVPFPEKRLQKTEEQDFEKVSFLMTDNWLQIIDIL